MYGKPPAYNTYATLPYTNPLFMGFSGYTNALKESSEYRKEQQTPKIQYFRGFLYIKAEAVESSKTREITLISFPVEL